MILRRIIEHVKAQNWFAVGLDFVIVVFGVLVGLQGNNWNEARAERAKEYGYLVRLHEDLTRSISTIERTVGMLERQALGKRFFSTHLRDVLSRQAQATRLNMRFPPWGI